jgi:gamma-glutamyltranspeptidase/glutathione hydrolase
MLDGYDDAAIDPSTPDGVHVAVEVTKLAFADRDAWYGDAVPPPLHALLDKGYTESRRALVGDDASLVLRPGAPDGQSPRLPALLAHMLNAPNPSEAAPDPAVAEPAERPRPEAAVPTQGTLGEPTVERDGIARGDTCHVDVVDRWGNIVSATPSGGWLQSSPVIPPLGFPLGTRLQMCWLEEGLPASLTPGRRPRTTLSPTMIYRDGRPAIACGTPGGDQQDQWQLVFLLSHLVRRLPLQAAIEAPSWHSNAVASSFFPRDSRPGELVMEGRWGGPAVDALRRRGHRVVVAEPWSLGRLAAVSRDPDTGLMQAAADPRGRQAYAVGR